MPAQDHDIPALVEAFRALDIKNPDFFDTPYRITPPATAEERQALEGLLGHPLPPDLAAFLAVTCGVEGTGIDIGVTADEGAFVRPFRIGVMIELGGDGAGNYWCAQPLREVTRVWWLCHDPAALVLSGRTFGEFLARRLDFARAFKAVTDDWHRRFKAKGHSRGAEGLPEDPDRQFIQVRSKSPEEVSPDNDPELAGWLAALPRDARVFDLRNAQGGHGVDLDEDSLLIRCEPRAYGQGDLVAFFPE